MRVGLIQQRRTRSLLQATAFKELRLRLEDAGVALCCKLRKSVGKRKIGLLAVRPLIEE
jgi:hypothetical protein